MSHPRYVRTLEEVKRAAEANAEFLESTVRSIRVVYETDPEVAAAVIPRPLEPAARPEVHVTLSQVAMHLTPEVTFEIGSGVFGVAATYDGAPGTYLLTMPMTSEQAVIGGRETYGEPKKIAQIDFERDGDAVSAVVARMGVPYLEFRGRCVERLAPREVVEHAYCFKALPSCEPDRAFDGDPLLVRLEWRQRHDEVVRLEGALTLRESPFDPVADLPVRRLVRAEYDVGRAESNGRVLRPIPGDWLLPYLHQRYDGVVPNE